MYTVCLQHINILHHHIALLREGKNLKIHGFQNALIVLSALPFLRV